MGAPKIAPVVGVNNMDLLRQSQLFQGLTEPALQFVATTVEPVFVRSGEPIILQNEVSDDVFIIEKGSIEIVTYVSELKQVNRLAVLRAGAHFSEFSVLNKTTKSASGFAIEDTHLLRISGENFLEILKKFPAVSRNLTLRLAQLNSAVADSKVFVEYFKPELIEIDKKILEILPINMWKRFEVLPLSFRSGVLTVAIKTPYNPMFYDQIRSHIPNVIINIFLIGDKDFNKVELELRSYYLGQEVPPQKEKTKIETAKDFQSILKSHPHFKELPESLLQQLYPHFKPIQLKSGQVLYDVGMPSGHYFMIESGQIEIAHPLKNTKAHTHVVTLGVGQGFSELSILNQTPHKHMAKAVGETVVRALDVKVFNELLKAPSFLLPLAQDLAKRLHKINNQIGLKYFEDIDKVNFSGIADLIPLAVMKMQKMIPLFCEDNELVVGLVNPESEEIYSLVSRYLANYRISLQMISQENFNRWISEIQKFSTRTEADESSKVKIRSGNKNEIKPVEELDKIFQEALRNRASDIHFEPGEQNVSVRFRVDGVLHERSENIPKQYHREFINRIKILAEMDISNDKSPQDGQLKTRIDEVDFIARVSTVPTKKGEKSVLRVIRASGGIVPLNMLAPDKRVIQVLKGVSEAKQGLFLVTGPTGSGKSTTLYSLLNQINQVGVNIMTIEDPVEKELAGLNQVQLHPKAGLTFPAALRSFLRQDPDVIMVGEIRDAESAHIVLEAAITGHLVLSTMHTNSSLDTISRLAEFEISPVTIASALLGCVSQRLLRANCKSCSEDRQTTDFEKEFFVQNLTGISPPETVKVGKGCVRCQGTGYLDRIPVFETWRATEEMRFTLAQKDQWEHLREIAEKDGFETILEFGLRMVLNGLTTVDEVKRCLL
ncbi:MAG: Flp pilus assembly complex ATPase component TadA [Bdellovibrionales bacterium]|nr:Flp pilus assembly complex ATPase component TadA [Bdellovibrionales bacterium]